MGTQVTPPVSHLVMHQSVAPKKVAPSKAEARDSAEREVGSSGTVFPDGRHAARAYADALPYMATCPDPSEDTPSLSSQRAGAPDFAVAAAPPSLPPTSCIGGRRRQRDGTQRDRKRGHRKLRCRWHTGGSRPRGRVVTVGLQHFGRICELGEGSLDRSAPG